MRQTVLFLCGNFLGQLYTTWYWHSPKESVLHWIHQLSTVVLTKSYLDMPLIPVPVSGKRWVTPCDQQGVQVCRERRRVPPSSDPSSLASNRGQSAFRACRREWCREHALAAVSRSLSLSLSLSLSFAGSSSLPLPPPLPRLPRLFRWHTASVPPYLSPPSPHSPPLPLPRISLYHPIPPPSPLLTFFPSFPLSLPPSPSLPPSLPPFTGVRAAHRRGRGRATACSRERRWL